MDRRKRGAPREGRRDERRRRHRRGLSVTILEARRVGAVASGWTLGGVRQSGRDPAGLPLARAAAARWGALDEELGAPTGDVRRGNLRLARTAQEVEAIAALVAVQRALGLDLEFLADGDAARAVAPALGPSILAASFCAGDGAVEPDLACAAYAAAARRLGASLREGAAAVPILERGGRVVGVATERGGAISCSRVVIAAGVETPRLLAPFGVAPTVGEIVRGLALGEAPAFDLSPFRAGRFAADAPAATLTLHGWRGATSRPRRG